MMNPAADVARDGVSALSVEAPAVSPIETLIRQCAGRVATQASEPLQRRLAGLAARFEEALAVGGTPAMRIFTFYAPVPTSHARIRYIDVEHDHHEFDYLGILRHFVVSAAATNPQAQIVIVTGSDVALPDFATPVTIVRLEIDSRRLMFERALAMTALVQSRVFGCDTVFLDTDAFPNRSLAPVFAQRFDLALTERPSLDFYMPINEGVIFASASDREAVRRFFGTFAATYERLITDEAVRRYYGDIQRWRGGQLTLNAVAEHFCTLAEGQVRVARIPCDSHNFWVEPHLIAEDQMWSGRFILHLKGNSKANFHDFERNHISTIHGIK